jgi:hypothetical protein
MRYTTSGNGKRIQEMINRIVCETGWYEPGDFLKYHSDNYDYDVSVGDEQWEDKCYLSEIYDYNIIVIKRLKK